MKTWLIVNEIDVDWARDISSGQIPPRNRPRFIHCDRPAAEEELLRLKKAHPRGEFVLYEAVAFAEYGPVGEDVIFIESIEED